MADYNSFVLEGIKIIFADNNKEFIKEICEPLINILCIEEGNDSNLLIVFYVQIMPDDFVMQLHRF